MSLDIDDAESSFLKGKAEFQEFIDNFTAHWWQPQIVDLMGTMVNTMPMQGRMMAPDATTQMEKVYRKLRGG